MRDRSFSSTFEDDEELAEDFPSDDVGDYDFVGRGFTDNSGNSGMGMSPSTNRGREFANQWSRSRSQSLATTTARAVPMPIGGSSYGHQAGTGSTYASWNEGLLSGSNSLNIPGTLGSSRWGDIRAPARNPTDISNQSPFVRDVGQILLEESSQFKQLWNQQQGRLDRDEILPSAGGVSRLGGAGFTRNVGSGSYLGGNGNGNVYGTIGGGLGGAAGYGYGGGGMGSGTSSRRHSVSIVQPRRGVQVGFDAGGHDDTFQDDEDPTRGASNGSLMGMALGSNGGGSGGNAVGGGPGGLMLSDEDLLGPGGEMGVGMLSLSSRLEGLQSQREGSSPSQRDSQQHTPQNQAGTGSASSSLPIYAPLSRSPPGANDLVSSYRQMNLNVGGDGSSGGRTPSDDRGVSPGQPPQQPQQQQQQQQQQHFFPTQQPQQPHPQYNQPSNEGSYAARARAVSQSGGIGGGPTSPISPTGTRGPGLGGIVQGMTQQQQQAYFGHPQQQQQQHGHPHPHPPQHHHQHGQHGQHSRQASNQQDAGEQGLGKGLPLSSVPSSWPLFIVEFKAGRTDLFYLTDQVAATILQGQMNGHAGEKPVKVGDLVIVEADRGRDLGRVVNDSITVNEVERWLETREHQTGQFGSQWGDQPMSPTSGPGGKKEITPKMIIGKAGAQEITQLAVKMQDENKALQLCQSKVRAKKLPMEVVDAEYQWDRRKLTFYFVAEKRIDFRELVRELFRLYKTRIWMASLQSSGGFEA
ncbi:hypothetical protein AAF712_009240 [Marasmius tenuissimus]|uniref:PSP1 C-terminal domain-containing protein n=1 Tax=Marasmius tenuissimus TaxID=585030 RepID=A0ABR2ZQ49_9AGAR